MWEFVIGAVVMGVGVLIGFVVASYNDNNEPTRVVNMSGPGNVKVLPRDEEA